MEKNLPAMQETQVRSLGWEDPLEKETATHSSILAQEIPWTRGVWQATIYGGQKSWTHEQLTLEESQRSFFFFNRHIIDSQVSGVQQGDSDI